MPTYHYVQNQGKLNMQSQKNGQKPQFEQFFLENRFFLKLKVIFSTNSRPKTKKIVRAVFEKNIKMTLLG